MVTRTGNLFRFFCCAALPARSLSNGADYICDASQYSEQTAEKPGDIACGPDYNDGGIIAHDWTVPGRLYPAFAYRDDTLSPGPLAAPRLDSPWRRAGAYYQLLS